MTGVRSDAESPAGEPVDRDWRFTRRPFWLFSHVFAISVVCLFVALGLWQLDRLGERRQTNDVMAARIAEPVTVTATPVGDDLEHQAAVVPATWIDGDLVRIANRSQGGVAGQHVVGVAELDDGSLLAVNRGFVPTGLDVELEPVPEGPTELSGWLRQSVERGRFGATDDGAGTALPRLDTEQVAARLGRPVAGPWLQLAPDEGPDARSFPDPLPPPALDEGPHLSYALQWFTFAVLGVGFYVALLFRHARPRSAALP